MGNFLLETVIASQDFPKPVQSRLHIVVEWRSRQCGRTVNYISHSSLPDEVNAALEGAVGSWEERDVDSSQKANWLR